ncbi:MAG: thiamine pyrophosphate-binding protein [Acidimicrobiales bacterium]
MRGRDVFMESLEAHGVTHIFGNPGTTESPLLDALADHPSISYVTHLHEGVAVGAAGYYARAADRPAVVSLHVAPGLGNGIGMIYGALKARAPIVVTAGQQDTRMLRHEPVLGHDLAAMAAPVTKWSTQIDTADEVNDVLRRAFKIALDPPCGPVFVAVPINVMEQDTVFAATGPGASFRAGAPDPAGLTQAAELIASSRRPVIVVGDDVGRAGAVDDLVRLAERIGAPVWREGIRGAVSFPTAHPLARAGLPFDDFSVQRSLGDTDLVVLLGGPFFESVWYAPESPIPTGARVLQIEASAGSLGRNHTPDVGLVADLGLAVAALDAAVASTVDGAWAAAAAERVGRLGEERAASDESYRARVEALWDRTPISIPRVMTELRAATPDNAVIVEESITGSTDFAACFQLDVGDDYLGPRGGGIGQAVAGAIGAAVAHPDRPVLCVTGDGSAMYSIQALWTAAHHCLDIVFVVLANREYRVLKHNLDIFRERFDAKSDEPYPEMDLDLPVIGYVELGEGMGVPGERVTKPNEIGAALERAFAAGGPRMVEIEIEGKR